MGYELDVVDSEFAIGEIRSVLFGFPVWLFLLLLAPFVLTLLAWIDGVRAMRVASESKAHIWARTLPPILFLAGPVVMSVGLFSPHMGHAMSLTAPGRMVFIGGASSLAALITSTRIPRNFRGVVFFAAAAWVVCFGLVLMAMLALSGLR